MNRTEIIQKLYQKRSRTALKKKKKETFPDNVRNTREQIQQASKEVTTTPDNKRRKKGWTSTLRRNLHLKENHWRKTTNAVQ